MWLRSFRYKLWSTEQAVWPQIRGQQQVLINASQTARAVTKTTVELTNAGVMMVLIIVLPTMMIFSSWWMIHVSHLIDQEPPAFKSLILFVFLLLSPLRIWYPRAFFLYYFSQECPTISLLSWFWLFTVSGQPSPSSSPPLRVQEKDMLLALRVKLLGYLILRGLGRMSLSVSW